MARIIVTGYMIRYPVAGNVWAFFSYILGLKRLGHEVFYLEESGWTNSVYDPRKQEWQDDPKVGIDVVKALMVEHKIEIPLYYINRDSGQVWGGTWKQIKQALNETDLLLNIGGVSWLPEYRLARRRAFVDMDPFFTQIGKFGAEAINEYQAYFTYGGNIGKSDCTIPTHGIDWCPTVPPVVVDSWSYALPAGNAPFTTIANWNAYGNVIFNGQVYAQKREEFLRFTDLPKLTSQKLELALSGIDSEEKSELKNAGWLIREAAEVGVSLKSYENYILSSKGEFSVGKNAYVKTNSGWFSDRSVCYLAAGLPVILQNTGFTDWLPFGGILAFSSVNEAVDCIEKVNADYLSFRKAAREIADRVFNYKVVLPRLLDIALKPAYSTLTGNGGIRCS
jgi:hypothetical protein